MRIPEAGEELSTALAEWRVTPRREPNFRASVWARIVAARRAASWSGYARAHLRPLGGALVIALLVGGWAGRERARSEAESNRAELARTYVQTLDARAMWAK